ncbi:MAG TPA: hypothetical protein PK121_02280 [Candidatus Pacearchaeota archaeon]|nr:hypothetical protein [Candidatus Pacearchaeota archaeon]
MPEKFFDIIPPKNDEEELDFDKIEEKEEEIKLNIKTYHKEEEKIGEINDFNQNKRRDYKKFGFKKDKIRKKHRINFKNIILSFLFIVLFCSGVYFIFFEKTRIEISPKTEILSLKDTIVIDKNASQADFLTRVIPGKVFTDERSASSNFPATGKVQKEEKAKGIIRVYNNYSTSPQTLVATTRFVSADGKLFRSIKQVTIPGATYEGNKLVPGFLDIEVQAAEPGEDYNIGPSTFSIPGFAGTDKYTAFYGKSFQPMKGGLKGEVLKVSEEDINNAKETLLKKLKEESINYLKNNISQDYILLDETVKEEVIKESSSVEVNKEANSFDFELTIKTEGLAFKKSDLDNFVKNIISLNLLEGKKIQEETISKKFSLKSRENDRVMLDLEIKARVYPDFDVNEVKKALAGKSLYEINNLISEDSMFSKIEIKSIPFWRETIPNDINKIEIDVNIDSSPL